MPSDKARTRATRTDRKITKEYTTKGLEDMDGYKELLAVIADLKAEIKELKENK